MTPAFAEAAASEAPVVFGEVGAEPDEVISCLTVAMPSIGLMAEARADPADPTGESWTENILA